MADVENSRGWTFMRHFGRWSLGAKLIVIGGLIAAFSLGTRLALNARRASQEIPPVGRRSTKDEIGGLAIKLLDQLESQAISNNTTQEIGGLSYIDQWGTPYRCFLIRDGVKVISAGADRKYGTKDDIVAEFWSNGRLNVTWEGGGIGGAGR
jgi:hypothetical protein